MFTPRPTMSGPRRVGAVLAAAWKDDPVVRTWNGADRGPELRHDAPVHALAFRRDGGQLATASKDEVQLWDPATGKQLDRLKAPPGIPVVCAIVYHPDRRHLIDTAVQTFGGLDLLVNNSGVGSFGHFSTSTEAVTATPGNYSRNIAATRSSCAALANECSRHTATACTCRRRHSAAAARTLASSSARSTTPPGPMRSVTSSTRGAGTGRAGLTQA